MSPRDLKKIETVEEIQRMAEGFRASRILLSAMDLEVFTILGQDVMTSEDLACRTGADIRATDRLLNALTVLGLLEKTLAGFRNTPASARYLSSESEDFLGGLGHQSNLFKRWATLTDAVKAGGRVMDHTLRSPEETDSFIAAMHSRARKNADKLVSLLDLEGVERLLDVGGGSGMYSMACCKARPGLKAVVFDVPEVTPLTRKYVALEGFGDCVSTRDGDYNTDNRGGNEFALVLCSAIIHINSPEENASLIERSAEALRPGGQLVIQDFIMEPDRLCPPYGAIFALNMLVNTLGGDTYTEDEIKGWMEQAGLKNFQRVGSGPGTTMLIGRKE